MAKGTAYTLQVQPRIPARLDRLNELASNLWYSWDRPTRGLFSLLHPGCGTPLAITRGRFCSGWTSVVCSKRQKTRLPGHVQQGALGVRYLPQRTLAPKRIRVVA